MGNVNFPTEYNLRIGSNDEPSDNRTIMVYKKGRIDGINRDIAIKPFKEGSSDRYGYVQ